VEIPHLNKSLKLGNSVETPLRRAKTADSFNESLEERRTAIFIVYITFADV